VNEADSCINRLEIGKKVKLKNVKAKVTILVVVLA